MRTYYSCKDVFLCLAENRYIALDLKTDRYISFDGPRADILETLIAARSADDLSEETKTKIPQSDIEETADQLVQNGLLTEDAGLGKPLVLTTFERPLNRLLDGNDEVRPRIRSGHLLAFLISCASASRKLRRRPISEIVDSVRQRKKQTGLRYNDSELKLTRELVRIFDILRPFYPLNYLCLFDSLALIEFLARYDVFPTWVFGVWTDPFHAHCWVQEGETVFNDYVDMIRGYTPVMTV